MKGLEEKGAFSKTCLCGYLVHWIRRKTAVFCQYVEEANCNSLDIIIVHTDVPIAHTTVLLY